jgi:hypothetical protein
MLGLTGPTIITSWKEMILSHLTLIISRSDYNCNFIFESFYSLTDWSLWH